MSTTSREGGPATPSADRPDLVKNSEPAAVTSKNDDKLDSAVMKVAAVVVLGAIMSILDVTVVNVAINDLANEFQTSLSTIQWVSTGYTLALATVIPLTGWGSDRFGTKRLYMISIGLFVIGSALSGAAWSAESLIFFRILQGFGGGMIMPAGMTILTRAAGPHRIGRVMAVIGVPMLLGPIFGPILGGWLVDDVSWRWIFFINLPIGVIALFASYRILATDVPEPGHRLDWLGLALLSPGLALLIYGFAESATVGGFGEFKVYGPMISGAVLLVAFLLHARGKDDALIDLKLFLNKTFAASTATLMLMIISVFGGMLLLPLYLQAVRGESALTTGLLLAPQGLGAMVAMPIAGRLTDKIGVGKIVPFGLLAVGLSFAALTQISATTSYVWISAVLVLMGAGMGFTMMPTFSGAMQTLKRASISRASTTLNITQQVGASIGTAVLTVILARLFATNDALIQGFGRFVATATAAGQPLTRTGQGDPSFFNLSESGRKLIAPELAQGFGTTFIWALALVVIAFAVAVIFLPKQHMEPVAEDGEPATAAAMMH